MIAVYILLGLLVLLGLLYVLCLRCRRRRDWERFRKWRFAHRGFHDKPRIPENSLPASAAPSSAASARSWTSIS